MNMILSFTIMNIGNSLFWYFSLLEGCYERRLKYGINSGLKADKRGGSEVSEGFISDETYLVITLTA